MKLYDLERSGNCYKIRLFLSILGIKYTKIPINPGAGENRTSDFLAMNPNGLVPVLVDGPTTLYDSAAILAYLAKKYGGDAWFPGETNQFANVIRWLVFEQSEGRYGLARARAIALKNPTSLARSGTLQESQALGIMALDKLNTQLIKTQWLAGDHVPTVCDIACYPYTAMSNEAGLSLDLYPGIKRWIQDIEGLPGHVLLPGINK